MAGEDMKRYTLSQGAEPESLATQAFADDIAAESARWAEVVKASGATVD